MDGVKSVIFGKSKTKITISLLFLKLKIVILIQKHVIAKLPLYDAMLLLILHLNLLFFVRIKEWPFCQFILNELNEHFTLLHLLVAFGNFRIRLLVFV